MANFLLHLYEGNGCDYTISCGETIREFEANSEKEIKEKVKEQIEYFGRERIQKATLYEITSNKEKLDIDDLFADDDAEEKAREEAIKVAKEIAQLEELKKKYPNLK